MPACHVEPRTVRPSELLWRVGRVHGPVHFSSLSPADGSLPRGGNRFDVVGGGVCYFASDPKGCYAETLSRFRPSARIQTVIQEAARDDEASFMICGGVPADWRAQRLLVGVGYTGDQPFLDVEHPDTHTYLTTALAPFLASLSVSALDVAAVRGPDRRVTRALSSWAYTQVDAAGERRYAGIRYVSRVGDHECWALFDTDAIAEQERKPILLSDPALKSICRRYGLTAF